MNEYQSKEKEAAPLPRERPQAKEPTASVSPKRSEVKAQPRFAVDDLRHLRTSKGIPAKDMVAVVQEIYPKYDKTVQSKCENGEAYGVSLREDAMIALYQRFAPDELAAKKARKGDGHRLTCCIKARLENDVYAALQQRIEAEGYATAQDWLTDKIILYLDAYDALPERSK